MEYWNARSAATRAATLLGTGALAAASVATAGLGVTVMAPLGEYSVWSRVFPEGETTPALVRHDSGLIGAISADASSNEGEDIDADIVADALRKPRKPRKQR